MSLNRLELYVPEMGISSPIVGIMHMSSLACSLVILSPSSAFLKQFSLSALLVLVTELLFLAIPRHVLSLLLDFRRTEGKSKVSCNFMSHSTPSRAGAQQRLTEYILHAVL